MTKLHDVSENNGVAFLKFYKSLSVDDDNFNTNNDAVLIYNMSKTMRDCNKVLYETTWEYVNIDYG